MSDGDPTRWDDETWASVENYERVRRERDRIRTKVRQHPTVRAAEAAAIAEILNAEER